MSLCSDQKIWEFKGAISSLVLSQIFVYMILAIASKYFSDSAVLRVHFPNNSNKTERMNQYDLRQL